MARLFPACELCFPIASTAMAQILRAPTVQDNRPAGGVRIAERGPKIQSEDVDRPLMYAYSSSQ